MSANRSRRIVASAFGNVAPFSSWSKGGSNPISKIFFAHLTSWEASLMTNPRQSLPLSQREVPPAAFEIESGMFSTPQHNTIHSIFAPMHYEPGYAYPLLVWLHGSLSDERQLLRIMPLVSMRNYVAVAPRGVEVAAPGRDAVYGWSHEERDLQSGSAYIDGEQRIFDAIDVAFRRFNVDSRRIFVAGFDSGGTMALRVAMNHPYRFAGVLSLGGCLPTGGAPLSRLPEARQLAVFLAAGRRSNVYGESHVCDDLRLLHTAGMSITLRLYPCGHELSPQMLSDVDRWIMEQIIASKALVTA
jgi:phospholipase/carboxylesterase